MTDISLINVYYQGFGEHRLVGHVALDGSRPTFSYSASWLVDGLPLSPLQMPLQSTAYYGQHKSASYLCGLLADSLPDGWGMLLMDRFFRQVFDKSAQQVNVLERLAYIGQSAMGALSFQPQHDVNDSIHYGAVEVSLSKLAQENQAILSGQDCEILAKLIAVGGSPQGARPKALVLFDKQSQFITTDLTMDLTTHQPSASHWLIKFPAQYEHKSVCLLEHIYADMATQAGLIMPAHHYFDIDENYGAFGVQRFDRIGEDRVHIHTLAGLLDLDFRTPSSDYLQFIRCVRMLTQSQLQVEHAYRQAVFNVVFNNKDDHSKNFSFMMDKLGNWSLSPVYDISYNTGINGYHQMDICGEAKAPTSAHLLKLAKLADIKQSTAQAIIEQVVATAHDFLNIIADYPIDRELCRAVIRDVQANIDRVG